MILLDVDPYMMTDKQCAWIADAVVSGTHLLSFGGPVTFTHAKKFRSPLRAVLPASFSRGSADLRVVSPPAAGDPHVLNRGIDPAGLGMVTAVQDLQPRPGAAVPWTAQGRPLVITAPIGKGGSTIVNTWPHVRESATGGFFTSPRSGELVRRLLAYALGRREAPPPTDERESGETAKQDNGPFVLDLTWARGKDTFAPGSPVEVEALLRRRDLPEIAAGERTRVACPDGSFPVSVDGFVDAWVYQPETSHLIHNQVGSAGVKTVSHGGLLPRWTVTGDPRAARADGSHTFADDDRILTCERTIETRDDGGVEIRTSYRILADMKVQRLPLTLSLACGSFAGLQYKAEQAEGLREGILPAESKKGKVFDGTGLRMVVSTPRGPLEIRILDPGLRVWFRDLRQYGMDNFRIEVEAPFENKDAKAGDTYDIAVRITPPRPPGAAANVLAGVPRIGSEGLALRARLLDPRSDYAWELPAVETREGFARFAGELPTLAAGEYELEVKVNSGTQRLLGNVVGCRVVDPLDLDDFFPIMSIVGIAGDGHYLDETGIEERVDDLLEHGFNTAAIAGIASFRSGRQINAQRLKGFAQSIALAKGMATTYEYTNFKLMNRKGKTRPCVFSPQYPDALRKILSWQIDVGNRTPRLISAKIVDEPHFGWRNMDACEFCGEVFQRRYGIDMGEESPERVTDPYRRWAAVDFIGAYVGHGYSLTEAILRENRASFDLLLTYMAMGLGYQRPLRSQQDTLDWTRYVRWADFDIYPYFYPASQRIRMVQAGFGMTFMRDVARARSVPWGFYVELDDRNWPFQKNPPEATAECAFTAIAHGAGYLNSFINRVASTGTQARPERWEAAGRALRAIRRLGPVLNRMPALRANVAFLYPNTQEAIGNGYARPDYVLAALKGGFGDVDIHNEQVILENGGIPYSGMILLKTEYVHEDLPPLLRSWLRAGGTLICDRLPAKTHRGNPIEWNLGEEALPGAVSPGDLIRYSVTRAGAGRLIRIENDINEEFRALVEDRTLQPEAVGAYRHALAAILNRRLSPNVRVQYEETSRSVDGVEAGLRGNEEGILVTVVNHQPDSRLVTLTVARPDIAWLVDAVTMRPVSFERTAEGSLLVELTVRGRWARLLTGYGTRPARLALDLEDRRLRRGEPLRYAIQVLDREKSLVKGGILLDVEVSDPNGVKVARFGTPSAPADGRHKVSVEIPINARKGKYRIVARAPQAGLSAAATFKVK